MLNAVIQMQKQKCKQWHYKDTVLYEFITSVITFNKSKKSDASGIINLGE